MDFEMAPIKVLIDCLCLKSAKLKICASSIILIAVKHGFNCTEAIYQQYIQYHAQQNIVFCHPVGQAVSTLQYGGHLGGEP